MAKESIGRWGWVRMFVAGPHWRGGAIQRSVQHAGGRGERGQVLLLFAAGLAAFCGFVGMSVDIGKVLYTKGDLQVIADAASLAAAQDLPASTGTATTTANAYAAKYASSTVTLSFSTTTNTNDTITVTSARYVNYIFLKVVGLNGASVSATAKAKGVPGKAVTGYTWATVAPFTIWGGTRTKEVNTGDGSCTLHVCVGKSYTFLDTNWMKASGTPTAPDWTANDSQNFKGDQDHGAGSPINQIGDFYSVGGLGSVTAPTVGSYIVLPVVDKSSGNSNLRTFHVAAWVVVRVDAGCVKGACTGTVQSPLTATPPAGYSTSGTVQPPGSLSYKAPGTGKLIQ